MSEEGAADLKAGHPPAVKVGGMRVVQHKKEGEKTESPPMTAEEEAEYGASPPKTDKHHQSLLVSGAVTKGDKDFTTQAVKSFHEKPLPTHDVKPRPVQHTQNIHQPSTGLYPGKDCDYEKEMSDDLLRDFPKFMCKFKKDYGFIS